MDKMPDEIWATDDESDAAGWYDEPVAGFKKFVRHDHKALKDAAEELETFVRLQSVFDKKPARALSALKAIIEGRHE